MYNRLIIRTLPLMLKKNFKNLPLHKKLTAMFMLSCFLPMLFVIIYSYLQTRSQMIGQSEANMRNTISQVNNNISQRVYSFHQISALLYTDTLLKGYLKKDYHKDRDFVDAYHYIDSLFYGILAANSDIDSLTVYIDNTSLPADSVFIKYLDDSGRTPERIRALDLSADHTLLVHPHSLPNGKRYLSFFTVLDHTNMNFPYGILELTVKESVFHNFYRQETKNKDIYITDADGVILSANHKDTITQNIKSVLGLSLNEIRDHEISMSVEGVDSIITTAGSASGLNAIAVIPSELILKDATLTSGRMILIAVLSLLFALYLISRVSLYFSRRFRLLGERIAKLEQGEFEVDGSGEGALMGTDEIGQLYQTFNKMSVKLNLLIDELYKKELGKKEAELQLLQSQFNPHFLYNTLAAISSLAIHNEDPETAKLTAHLSQFYKISLHKGQWYIGVKKELDITRHYIAIQHKRFRNRFIDLWEIDEQILAFVTLKLILQPFVENAITHALPEDLSPVTIKICARLLENRICYTIEDNGSGMTEDTLTALRKEDSQCGYGIRNTRDRIRLAYGRDYDFTIHSTYGQGTRIEIRLPCVR